MKRMYLMILIVTSMVMACQNQTTPSVDLTLLNHDDIINRAKAGNFDYRHAVIKNEDGSRINSKTQALLNEGGLGKDYYTDKEGVIREIRVRPLNLQDQFTEIQQREIKNQPLKGIQLFDYDCTKVDAVFTEIDSTYRAVRKNRGDVAAVDYQNLQKLISALERCGWSDRHSSTIWKVMQSAPSGIKAYYLDELKTYSKSSKNYGASFAVLQDGLLMTHGYPQLYGTQIRNKELYKLHKPDGVNQRRKSVGLGPIEDFLKIWGLDFQAELKRLAEEE